MSSTAPKPSDLARCLAVAVAVAALAAPHPAAAWSPQPLRPGGLVTMFSGPAAQPNPTAQALLQVGQEMVQEYVDQNGNPYLQAVENAMVPVVDGYLQQTLAPIAPMVAGITKQENATADYIKEVDAALVDAIEESFANPQNAQQAVRSFSERVWTPVGEVVDQATANVRRNVVETADERLHRLMEPFMPFAHLMGKDGDVDAWIEAVDESLGNVIELQPLSEEAKALQELREVLMDPYHRAKLTTMGQIDEDYACLEGQGGEGCGDMSAAAVPDENPMQQWYRRFWEIRNGLTGRRSIGDVLGGAGPATGGAGAIPAAAQPAAASPQTLQTPQMPQPIQNMFQGDGVTKEHFQAHENKLSKQRSMQAIRMRLKTLVGTETDVSELLKMNPRFLLKHPNWPQATAAKLREANPSITNQEVADTLTDMLRMKRMKQQARILATKGCTSATIEQKLKEYWVDNKKIDMQKVEC